MNFCAEIQRDRGGIEKMKSRNLKAMLFGAAFAASLTFCLLYTSDAADE